jgi:hypothetical protein
MCLKSVQCRQQAPARPTLHCKAGRINITNRSSSTAWKPPSAPQLSLAGSRSKALSVSPVAIPRYINQTNTTNARSTASYSYFHAHYLFTAAIALLMCTTMSSHPTTDPTTHDEASTYGPDEQHAALKVALSLLGDQAAAGNAPAREFRKEVDVLQQNLQALEQLLLQQRPEAGEHVFDLLVE